MDKKAKFNPIKAGPSLIGVFISILFIWLIVCLAYFWIENLSDISNRHIHIGQTFDFKMQIKYLSKRVSIRSAMKKTFLALNCYLVRSRNLMLLLLVLSSDWEVNRRSDIITPEAGIPITLNYEYPEENLLYCRYNIL